MNFRVNLAVAFAAALSFACADKQAAIPELEEALKAPPGQKVIGLYKMTVTPVEGAAGQYAWQAIPVDKDGVATTNPPNTVQVNGTFGQVTNAGPGACAGSPALTAAVRITNFMVDPLKNVWADVVNMSGFNTNTACNSTSRLEAGGNNFSGADSTMGLWRYGDLAGAPNSLGTVAGGNALPVALSGGVWGFRRVTQTGFAFYFRIMADDQSPALAITDPAGPAAPVTWTSAVAANTRIEVCPVAPGLGEKGDPCPVALTIDQAVAGVGTGPWTYSYAPTGLVQGNTYYWRARNVFPAGTSTLTSGWGSFVYNEAVPVVRTPATIAGPPVVPHTFLANDTAALLEWTTAPATVETYYYLCDTTCGGATPVILAQGPVPADTLPDPRWPGLSYYQVAPAFALDPLTLDPLALPPAGIYWTALKSYEVVVYNYDGVNVPLLGAPGFGSDSTSIAPVGIVPTNLAPAAGTVSVAATTFTWNADPLVAGGTTVDFIDLTDGTPIGQNVLAGPTYSLAASATNLSTWITASTPVEVQIFNTDLYGSISFLTRTYTMIP